MTGKERSYLSKLAAQINPVVMVGKDSVTPQVVNSADEALEARELIKVSVVRNCPDEMQYIADMISERTRSRIVRIIGRKIILFRPSKESKIKLPK